MFIIKPEKLALNEFQFYLLDVGQGLSTVVQTRNHILVFDTGPAFRSGFNTGESVVLPFLKSLAIDKIDILMISHGDNDHIGGMQSIVENIPIETIFSGAMHKTEMANAQSCIAGAQWQWDGVNFEILHPSSPESMNSGNNGSCVLRVSVADYTFLLTGDIERAAEKQLLDRYPLKIKADVLVAPHHGSNTSSTLLFIQAVGPQWVLFPAGYLNRFKFPNENVLMRYAESGVKNLTTGKGGMIHFFLNKDGKIFTKMYRQENRRFWHNPHLSG